MPLTKRFGLLAASESMRVKVTEDAGSASAFLLTKTRPADVADHRVEESPAVRRSAATPLPPVRSKPKPLPINCPAALGSPSGTQSPQATLKTPVNSLQFARKAATLWAPTPCVLVRHTWPVPAYMVALTAGSEMMGK